MKLSPAMHPEREKGKAREVKAKERNNDESREVHNFN